MRRSNRVKTTATLLTLRMTTAEVVREIATVEQIAVDAELQRRIARHRERYARIVARRIAGPLGPRQLPPTGRGRGLV